MARQKISQTEAAQALGMTVSAVSRRVRGLIPVTALELKGFATLLGVSADSLLTEHKGAA